MVPHPRLKQFSQGTWNTPKSASILKQIRTKKLDNLAVATELEAVAEKRGRSSVTTIELQSRHTVYIPRKTWVLDLASCAPLELVRLLLGCWSYG